MNSEIVKLNPLIFDGEKIIKSIPERIAKKSKDVWDKNTFIYDVFHDGKDIKAIAPRLYNYNDFIDRSVIEFKIDGTELSPLRYTVSRTSYFEFSNENDFKNAKKLTVILDENTEYQASIGKNYVEELAGHNILVTINKNNNLVWIYDWATHYVKQHNIDTIILFDNGSDKYEINQILRTLENVDGLENAFVIPSPFIYGTPGATNWYENAMRNIAHFRFAKKANLVLIMDIDELLVSEDATPINQFMAQSNVSYVRFPSVFIENIRQQQAATATFKDFTVVNRNSIDNLEKLLILNEHDQSKQVQTLSPKFAYSPIKNDRIFLRVHAAFFPKIVDGVETFEYSAKKVSNNFKILHYRGISSSSSFWHESDGGLHRLQDFNIKEHAELPDNIINQLENSFGKFENLRFGVKKVSEFAIKIHDPESKINNIILKKSGSEQIIDVEFDRKGQNLLIDNSQFYKLELGAYFAHYLDKDGKYRAIPALLETFNKIQYKVYNHQLLISFYVTKGGNFGIRAHKLDTSFSLPSNDMFISVLREHNVFLQQNGKYNRISGDYSVDKSLRIEPYTQLVNTNNTLFSIGMASYVKNVDFPANTVIGRYTSIAPGVKAMRGGRHPMNRFTTSQVTLSNPTEFGAIPTHAGLVNYNKLETAYYKERYDPIIIGNDVWIGQDVTIKRGVKIGDGAIIAQGAIVTKDVPPYALVAGVPAVVKRYRFTNQVIQELLELRWWDYAYWDFEGVKAEDNIEIFIKKIKRLISSQKLEKFAPDTVGYDDLKSNRKND